MRLHVKIVNKLSVNEKTAIENNPNPNPNSRHEFNFYG